LTIFRPPKSELEKILLENGIGSTQEIEEAKSDSGGLGLFVRGLVGLDRQAAKAAFAQFLNGKNFSGNQIEFVNEIIDHLTEQGVVNVAALYESPYTDIHPKGPDGVFAPAEVEASTISRIARLRSCRHAKPPNTPSPLHKKRQIVKP
jgi:Type I site-specific restriction-modification system, R (restriction) subunit and related helicases